MAAVVLAAKDGAADDAVDSPPEFLRVLVGRGELVTRPGGKKPHQGYEVSSKQRVARKIF
jgi:hypothetical protein